MSRARMFVIVGAALALVVGAVAVLSGGDGDGAATELFLEPVASVTSDGFTQSVAIGTPAPPAPVVVSPGAGTGTGTPTEQTSTTPAGAVEAAEVSGSEPGLYGGTRERAECDPDRLVAFLNANPDKARAWAEVQGIEATGINAYVDGLTPVLLRRDTLVTNHGYRNGVATGKQSVLQAGTAVLVDAFGVPRVKCECGNPLAEPTSTSARPTYRGAPWTGFSPTAVVEVSVDVRVDEMVLVDTETQGRFTRPVGTTGSGDGDLSVETCDVYPKDPSCPTEKESTESTGGSQPTSTAPKSSTTTTPPVPTGEPVELFTVYSLAGVSNGPTVPSVFTFEEATYVTMIMTYHYLSGGASPGTIALENEEGEVFGPFQASGGLGQGGVDNAYWQAPVNEFIPAGTYTFVDSDPSTWSIAPDTGGKGICWVFGYPPQGGK